MAEDDREWVFESIVGYLSSPIWLIPVTEFVETKSLGKKNVTCFLLGQVFLWLCTVSSVAKLMQSPYSRLARLAAS